MTIFELFERRLFNEETGGEGEGAPAAGGSLIGGAEDSGAEGEGTPEGDAPAADDAGSEGEATTPDEGEGGEEKGEEPEGAPEKYEEFEVPEGYVMKDESLTQFQEYARERNLSQEQAQELINFHAENVQAIFKDQADAWEQTRNDWIQSAKADKEFGGMQFNENMKHVAAAVKQFGTPELKNVLNESGLGDNPELVRFFYRVGKLVGEGEFHTGTGGGSGDRDPANTLYPNMN